MLAIIADAPAASSSEAPTLMSASRTEVPATPFASAEYNCLQCVHLV